MLLEQPCYNHLLDTCRSNPQTPQLITCVLQTPGTPARIRRTLLSRKWLGRLCSASAARASAEKACVQRRAGQQPSHACGYLALYAATQRGPSYPDTHSTARRGGAGGFLAACQPLQGRARIMPGSSGPAPSDYEDSVGGWQGQACRLFADPRKVCRPVHLAWLAASHRRHASAKHEDEHHHLCLDFKKFWSKTS